MTGQEAAAKAKAPATTATPALALVDLNKA